MWGGGVWISPPTQGDGTRGKKPQIFPRAVDPGLPPRPAGTRPLPAPRYKLPWPLAQPARAAEGSDRSRPAAGATAPLPRGSGRLRTVAAGPRRSGERGRRDGGGPQPLLGTMNPYLPASGPAAARSITSPRAPSSPAAIATGSRGSRISREAPSSRGSPGPRRRRLLSREG